MDVPVIAIDFVAMLAQRFTATGARARLLPVEPPINCADTAQQALDQIVDQRGQL